MFRRHRYRYDRRGPVPRFASTSSVLHLERFPAKWMPVRVKKTRQNKKIEPRSDSIGTEKALVKRTQHQVADQRINRDHQASEGERRFQELPVADFRVPDRPQ